MFETVTHSFVVQLKQRTALFWSMLAKHVCVVTPVLFVYIRESSVIEGVEQVHLEIGILVDKLQGRKREGGKDGRERLVIGVC